MDIVELINNLMYCIEKLVEIITYFEEHPVLFAITIALVIFVFACIWKLGKKIRKFIRDIFGW